MNRKRRGGGKCYEEFKENIDGGVDGRGSVARRVRSFERVRAEEQQQSTGQGSGKGEDAGQGTPRQHQQLG